MEKLKVLEFISYACGDCADHSYGNGYGDFYCDGLGSGTCDSAGYGDGSGYGEGYGSGYGSGSGDGYGSGDGSGDGYCSDDGYGSGYCNGLKSINGKNIYMVDCIAITISHIHGNTAKGTIVNNDLTETPCYIVKEGKYFAHGKTLAEAHKALQDKLFDRMSTEARIAEFWKCHKKGVKYPTKDFFEWHHKLTGSCLMGRHQFAKDHDVDLDGEMTVEEFIKLTKNSFGGDIIKKLEND